MTRVHTERLSAEHQKYISKVQEAGERQKRPHAKKDRALCAFGYEFDSKLEVDFAHDLERRYCAKEFADWRYHPMRFWLAKGVTYEPDFRILSHGMVPKLTFYEVKGSWKAKNARDSRTRLKIAASMNQWCDWFAVTREDGEWVFETIHSTDGGGG